MHSQPKSRVLIELCFACLCIVCNPRRQQLPITFNFCGSGTGIDDRLDNPARAENRGWAKCQNLFCGATLSLVYFSNNRAAGFELIDMVLENRLGDRDQSGDVVVSPPGAGFDISEVRSAAGFRTKTEKEQIDAAQRLKSFDVTCQFGFE